MMPPLHTLMPASRTASIVSRRSSNLRVVMTCGRAGEVEVSGIPSASRGRAAHLRVVLARRVEVVVVRREARLLELRRLLGREHAEGRAHLHVERAAGKEGDVASQSLH